MVLVYDSSGRAQGAGLDIELIELVEMSGRLDFIAMLPFDRLREHSFGRFR